MTERTIFVRRFLLAAVATLPLAAACTTTGSRAASPAQAQEEKKEGKEKMWTKTDSGLQYRDVKEGTGTEAKAGQTVEVHYTGWLWVNGVKGEKFDSSKDRNKPFDFGLGEGKVIKGWDEGVAGMKVGGTRELLIPPQLGYGSRGAGGVIPPNATLFFEVELRKTK